MKETISNSTQWNNAAKAGLVLGGTVIVYSFATLLLSKVHGSAIVLILMRLLNYILWFAKLVGCFLLMKYFIRKQSRTYSGVDTRTSFSYGLKIALCSALICAAYTLWSVTQIDAEGLTTLFNEAISENQVDNNTKAAIEKLINNAPVLFTVAQFIYCFLCGLIITSIITRTTPTEDIDNQ